MFKSNAKYYIKQSISPTAGVGDTFNISTDFELGLDLETGTDTVSVLLTSGTQIERMTITATGGVATIVQRGLTQADTKVEDTNLNKQWNDGAIMVITAFASDLPDLDKSSGINIFTSDIGVSDGKKIYVGNNAYLTTTNNGTDLEFKDGNNALTTLSELTSGAGADHKLKISATDTTAGFLDGKLTAGDGISKTLLNSGSDESIDLDIDLTDTTIFVSTSSGIGDSGKLARLNSLGKINSFINSQSDGGASETEKGLVEMATDNEVITGGDKTRYINPYQNSLIGLVASDNIKLSADTERLYNIDDGNLSGYIRKVKEFKINNYPKGGTVKIKWEMYGEYVDGTHYTRIYAGIKKSGVAVGTVQNTTSNTYVQFEQIINNVVDGDTIELWNSISDMGPTGNVGIKNCKLCYDEVSYPKVLNTLD